MVMPNILGSVVIASMVSAMFSIVGCLFIIFFYFHYKEYRSFAFQLIFYLSIVDFCEAILHLCVPLVYDNQTSTLCSIHGFLANYFNLSSVIWTSVIAISIYLLLHKPNTPLEKYKKIFLVYATLLPLFISALPFIWNDYGPSPGWCWIRNDEDLRLRIFLTIIEFYGPLWVVFIINLYLYWRSSRLIKKYIGKSEQLKIVERLKYYPLILVICWTAGTIHRLYTLENDPETWMIILNCFFGGLQGFFNALVYGSTENVKKELKDLCVSFSKKFKRNSSNDQNNEEKLLVADDSIQTDQEKNTAAPPELINTEKLLVADTNNEGYSKQVTNTEDNMQSTKDPFYFQSAIMDEKLKNKDSLNIFRMSHHTKSN